MATTPSYPHSNVNDRINARAAKANGPEFLHVNKLYFFLSIGLIALGMILMYFDSAPYGFGTMGLTVGSFTALIGFLLPMVAVMLPKKSEPVMLIEKDETKKA